MTKITKQDFSDVRIDGNYTYNEKIYFDGKWKHLETFKLIFNDKKIESIENIVVGDKNEIQ